MTLALSWKSAAKLEARDTDTSYKFSINVIFETKVDHRNLNLTFSQCPIVYCYVSE